MSTTQPTPKFTPPSESSHWRLGFWALIVTQFQTAFNDYGVQWVVIYLVVATNFSHAARDRFMLVVGAVLAIPFLLFSMLGGNFADRYSKRTVTMGTKLMEMVTMGITIFGLYLHNLPIECAGVFLISSQSALFGPSKYGLLPELVPESKLSWANGILGLVTFLGSILAVMAAGYMVVTLQSREYIAGLALLGTSVLGFIASTLISKVPAADPEKKLKLNPLIDLREQMKAVNADRALAWAVAGNVFLWFLAAFVQYAIVIFGSDYLRVNEELTSYMQAALAIGVCIGSVAAGYLSHGKIEVNLIPAGRRRHDAFRPLPLRLRPHAHQRHLPALPARLLRRLLCRPDRRAHSASRPKPEEKGGVLAAANFWSFAGVGVAPGVFWFFHTVLHHPPDRVFLDGAILIGIMSLFAIYLVPDILVRVVIWIVMHSIYHLQSRHRENIPKTGGALLVSNHMSLIDALLILGAARRPVRFLIFKDIYDMPAVNLFARMIDAIPISSSLRPRDMIHSLRAATEAIKSGELVCIFAEGQITRIGNLLPFRRGLERIMKNVDAPIIPVYLDGMWGSVFSFERGRFIWKLPAAFPTPSPSLSASLCPEIPKASPCARPCRNCRPIPSPNTARACAHSCAASCIPRMCIRSASPWETSAARA